MTSAKITLHEGLTAHKALEHLRTLAPSSEDVYYLFVVDADVRLVGVVSLRQLVIASPSDLVQDIMDRDVISIQASADQEDAARLMARYDLIALPVVDDDDHLLGLITHDDLVQVLEEEATEDIYRLGGVPGEYTPDTALPMALRSRLPWLVLNLGTALISAVVLSVFENTIAKVAVLAAFFPMVAGVSGSAGTQTLTVTVRRLALGELVPHESLKTLEREAIIGLFNGVTVGLIVGVIALLWKGTAMLGLVAGAAILLNMIAAAVAGVLVPIGMHKLHFDPALASPILVTTLTDTAGYFIYLGLATVVFIRLV
jgi:magnesium transporter